MFRLKDDSDEEKFEDKVYIPGEKLEEGQQLEVNISSQIKKKKRFLFLNWIFIFARYITLKTHFSSV